MEIRKYTQEELATTLKIETVDGVHAPQKELADAMAEADKSDKMQFVGTYYERNPECKDADKPGYNANRIRMTGKFILSDSRDDIYQHKCDPGEFLGGIVSLPPSKDKVRLSSGERKHHQLPSEAPTKVTPIISASENISKLRENYMNSYIRMQERGVPHGAENVLKEAGLAANFEIAIQLAKLNDRMEANGYPLAGPVHLRPKGKAVEQP